MQPQLVCSSEELSKAPFTLSEDATSALYLAHVIFSTFNKDLKFTLRTNLKTDLPIHWHGSCVQQPDKTESIRTKH